MPVLPDWYCCVSVAIQAEEDEAYDSGFYAYLAAGGNPKKFPKRPRRYTTPAEVNRQVENPFNTVMGALRMSGGAIPGRRGSIEEYARLKGLQTVYQMPDGTFTDKDGNQIEPVPGSVFVKK